jgi:hypothetical protein
MVKQMDSLDFANQVVLSFYNSINLPKVKKKKKKNKFKFLKGNVGIQNPNK